MERNYDEIIAEMLMQIDKHTGELIAVRTSQEKINEAMLKKFQGMEKIDSNLLQQLVHSANILDRIIRKNDLRV